jgi:hypothetical protein
MTKITYLHLKHLKHNNPEVRLHLKCIIGRWRFFIIPAKWFLLGDWELFITQFQYAGG